MKNTVIIKGNKYGITIVLDEEVEFPILLKDLESKLYKAEDFFDSDKQLAVSFEGRALSNDELDQILDVIQQNSKLNIQYVMEENNDLETTFFDIIQTAKNEKKEEEPKEEELIEVTQIPEVAKEPEQIKKLPTDSVKEDNNGMFYRGTLRSGQTLETKNSLVIIGDVNPGAKVIAGGNIVILGALKGRVSAGHPSDSSAFVMALSMEAIQIQIADIIARSADTKKKTKKEAMIATVVDNQICIEPISKSSMQDIYL